MAAEPSRQAGAPRPGESFLQDYPTKREAETIGRPFWREILVKKGYARTHGVVVRRNRGTWAVYVGPHEQGATTR